MLNLVIGNADIKYLLLRNKMIHFGGFHNTCQTLGRAVTCFNIRRFGECKLIYEQAKSALNKPPVLSGKKSSDDPTAPLSSFISAKLERFKQNTEV